MTRRDWFRRIVLGGLAALAARQVPFAQPFTATPDYWATWLQREINRVAAAGGGEIAIPAGVTIRAQLRLPAHGGGWTQIRGGLR